MHRDRIAKMIANMQEMGIVRPSSGPWASPIVLLPKKDANLGCVDYRRLNAIIKNYADYMLQSHNVSTEGFLEGANSLFRPPLNAALC